MTVEITRRHALGWIVASGAQCIFSHANADEADRSERPNAPSSRYRLAFTHSKDNLIGDILHGPRGEAHRQSELPRHAWYTRETEHRFGSWGPKPRHYEPLEGIDDRPLAWQRERVLAVAERFIGYGYQHHHIPDWDPPAHWPWKHSCVGHNGRGVDCSNFTSFVYNQGFGIHMSSEVVRQSKLHAVAEGEHRTQLQRIDLPEAYDDRLKVLKTSDLLYIRGRVGGPITHVVLWVGSVGRSGSNTPLIIDSHGGGVENDEGRAIPCGIHLRPFREDSWYNRCASHAHRVFE